MATATPPCPKCAGVLRRSYVDDSAICRCGFTVDHEAIVACGGDAARLLSAGRMTPVPEGNPGIYVGERIGDISEKCWDLRYGDPCEPELRRAIRDAAIERGAKHGLLFQHDQARGAYFLVEGPNGERRELKRSVMYGMAPLGREVEAARRMIDAVAVKSGPGRWWSLLDPVHVVEDDGKTCIADIGGTPHVRMRAVYCHDPLPRPVDSLDVEYDDVTLRDLLEVSEAIAQERPVAERIPHPLPIPFTPAQRAAVSAHWSADLRKRTEAAKQKDRNQVTMEQDDE